MRRVLVDSGLLAALFDADDHRHARSREFLRGFRGKLLCSAANVTEAVWVASNASFAVASNLVERLARGAVRIFNVESRDLTRIGEMMLKYRDQDPDFADRALLSLAERERVFEVVTIDATDFARYRLPRGRRILNLLSAVSR